MNHPSNRRTLIVVLAVVLPVILCAALAVGLLLAPDARGPATAEAQDRPTAAGTRKKDVLKSSLAGTWYNGDANGLRAELASYFVKAEVEPSEEIVALVLPHAGYAYSGQTAACGVKSLGRSYKRVVVIGPTHRLPMEDMFSVPRVTHYETPLGQVPLDVSFIEQLLKHPMFRNVPMAHQEEHSVQIEVPLLQYKLGDFQLVPIVAGQCSYETVAKAAEILTSLIDADTLVVASSDFTHYGLRYQYIPFSKEVPENLKKLDMGAYEFIEKVDAQGFLTYRQHTGATICGCVPIAVVLQMLGEETEAKLVQYTTSGELTGDYSNSVSYLAVTLCGAWRDNSSPAASDGSASLTGEDKKQLLLLVRRAIRYGLEHQRMPGPSDLNFAPAQSMTLPRAAFVTLKKNGELRGCIGDIFPQRPLYKSVITNAIYAAFGDRRFQPLQEEEYDQIKIEISALTAPSSVASWHDIRIGVDGMVLKKDGRSAVFLPQVAPEQGWNLEMTLQHLSLKAGLPPDAWKEGASFEVFQADVFGEEP